MKGRLEWYTFRILKPQKNIYQNIPRPLKTILKPQMFISASWRGFFGFSTTWTQSLIPPGSVDFRNPPPELSLPAKTRRPVPNANGLSAGVNGPSFAARKKHGIMACFPWDLAAKVSKFSQIVFFFGPKRLECSTGKNFCFAIWWLPSRTDSGTRWVLWGFSETPHDHRFQSKWCWARWGERPRWRPHFALGVLMPGNLVMESKL